MTGFRWAVIGTGAVSAKFVAGLAATRDARAVLVASRALATAEAFAGAVGVARAVEGDDPAGWRGAVDAVYIASPPSEHRRQAIACLEAGLPVLIEKPFAASLADGEAIAAAARATGTFAMEAMWTRFMPAAQLLRDRVAAGAVGAVHLVSGSFGTSYRPDPAQSAFDPVRGGGALGQFAVYPLSLAQWLFGSPSNVTATARIGATGVEESVSLSLAYASGPLASFFVSNRAPAPNDFHVMGTDGIISLQGSIFRPRGVVLTQTSPRGPERLAGGAKARLRESGIAHTAIQVAGITSRGGRTVAARYRGNGYTHEAEEVQACVAAGQHESTTMPLADSLAVLATVDDVRRVIAR